MNGQERATAEFERGSVGVGIRILDGLAFAFRLVEEVNRMDCGKHRNRCAADAVQVYPALQLFAVDPANVFDSRKYDCGCFHRKITEITELIFGGGENQSDFLE